MKLAILSISIFIALESFAINNKAFEVLNSCEEKYKADNPDFLDKMVASRRKIFTNISYGQFKCRDSNDLIFKESELNQLINTSSEIVDSIRTNDLLRSVSEASLKVGLDNLITHYKTFRDEQSLQKLKQHLKQKIPHLNLKSNLFNETWNQSLNSLKDVRPISRTTIQDKYRGFGKKINDLCQKYMKITMERAHISSGVTYRVNKKERELVRKEMSRELNQQVHKFSSENPQIARLLLSKTFREIMPMDKAMVRNCTNRVNLNPINTSKIAEMNIRYAITEARISTIENLNNSTKSFVSLKNKNLEEQNNDLRDLMKYNPLMIGDFLKNITNETVQTDYGRLLCQNGLEIYNSDEYWNKGLIVGGLALGFVPGGLGVAMKTSLTTTLITGATLSSVEAAVIYNIESSNASKIRAGAKDGDFQIFLTQEEVANDSELNATFSAITLVAAPVVRSIATAYKGYKVASRNRSNLKNSNNNSYDDIPKGRTVLDIAYKNAALSSDQKIFSLKNRFPNLFLNKTDDEIAKTLKAIEDVHSNPNLICFIGRCKDEVLKEKLKRLANAGIDLETRKALIREGYAGFIDFTRPLNVRSSIVSVENRRELEGIFYFDSKPVKRIGGGDGYSNYLKEDGRPIILTYDPDSLSPEVAKELNILSKFVPDTKTKKPVPNANPDETGSKYKMVLSNCDSDRKCDVDKDLLNNHRAVWEPHPDGTNEVWASNYRANIFASSVDLDYDIGLVPITVYREIDGVPGSMRLYKNQSDKTKADLLPGERAKITFFNFLIDNRDDYIKYSEDFAEPNFLVNANGKAVLHDVGMSFTGRGTHPVTVPITPVPSNAQQFQPRFGPDLKEFMSTDKGMEVMDKMRENYLNPNYRDELKAVLGQEDAERMLERMRFLIQYDEKLITGS